MKNKVFSSFINKSTNEMKRFFFFFLLRHTLHLISQPHSLFIFFFSRFSLKYKFIYLFIVAVIPLKRNSQFYYLNKKNFFSYIRLFFSSAFNLRRVYAPIRPKLNEWHLSILPGQVSLLCVCVLFYLFWRVRAILDCNAHSFH